MIVLSCFALIIDEVCEIFAKICILIEGKWQFVDWFVHESNVVNGMLLHGANNKMKIYLSEEHMIMLED